MRPIPIALVLAVVVPAALRAQAASDPPPVDPADTLKAVEMSAVQRRPSFADRAEVERVVSASYPSELRDGRVAGTVVVRVVVDAHGRPLAPRVAESSGNPRFDHAGLEVVRGIRFVPAEMGGAAHPVWVDLPVAFVPPNGPAPRRQRPEPDSLGAYEMSEVHDLPILRNRGDVARNIARAYPPELRRTGVTGMVTVRFLLDAEGVPVPGTVEVEKADPADFTAPAVQVVEKMRFQPARVDRKRVPVWVTLPLMFRLARP